MLKAREQDVKIRKFFTIRNRLIKVCQGLHSSFLIIEKYIQVHEQDTVLKVKQ